MPEFESSTQTIPGTGEVPRHVAIIMDGNGRWAKNRFLPRVAGHRHADELAAAQQVVGGVEGNPARARQVGLQPGSAQ